MPARDWTRVEDGIFHAFHLAWIARLSDRLNDRLLPDSYYALPEQHAGESIADVLTFRRRDESVTEYGQTSTGVSAGTLLLAEAPPRVDIVTELQSDTYIRKRRTLAIRHITDDYLIALIEILSPGNKSSQHAFSQFIDKALQALDFGLHLLLVDLHLPTSRDPQGIHAAITGALGRMATGLNPAKPLTLASYLARGDRKGFAQPLAVGDRLRDMPLFLSENEYVNVPLEETYMSAFEHLPRHIQAALAAH